MAWKFLAAFFAVGCLAAAIDLSLDSVRGSVARNFLVGLLALACVALLVDVGVIAAYFVRKVLGI
jgi:hypothetical protein